VSISPNAPIIQQAGFALVSAFVHGSSDEAGDTCDAVANSLRAEGYSEFELYLSVLLAGGYLLRRLEQLRPDLDHLGDLGLMAAELEADYKQWIADGQPDEDDEDDDE
jgi:hypothetical protein